MYQLLESKIALRGLNKKYIASHLDMGYNTLLLKLKGKSCFTLDEAVAFKRLLKADESIEELFNKDEKREQYK